jgi:hypothetical protein
MSSGKAGRRRPRGRAREAASTSSTEGAKQVPAKEHSAPAVPVRRGLTRRVRSGTGTAGLSATLGLSVVLLARDVAVNAGSGLVPSQLVEDHPVAAIGLLLLLSAAALVANEARPRSVAGAADEPAAGPTGERHESATASLRGPGTSQGGNGWQWLSVPRLRVLLALSVTFTFVYLVAQWPRGPQLNFISPSAEYPCSQTSGWVIPAGAPSPPSAQWALQRPQDLQRWLRAHRAVQAARSDIRMTLRGRSQAVGIQDIRVTLTARRPPLRGTHLSPACGGGLPERRYQVMVDLDGLAVGQTRSLRAAGGVPSAVSAESYESGFGPIRLPFTVTSQELAYVDLTAQTQECDCEWVVEVLWIDGEEEGTSRYPERGRSLRLTAANMSRPAK